MRFGVATFVTDEGIGPAALGPAVEERGFEALFVAEHTHIPAGRESQSPYHARGELPRYYYRTLDPFQTLAAIAPLTSRLLLGTGITLVVERDPIITAKEVATLDLLSGGRAVFGVGAGWNLEEMRNHGTHPPTRGRLMDERMGAIRELWTKEIAEYHGDLVHITPSYCWPKPVQQPHPPIYVGGDSPHTFRRIAEYGAGWLAAGLRPKELGPRMARLHEAAGADKRVLVYMAPHDPQIVEEYLALGVDGLLFRLPTRPEDETLRTLDSLAELAGRYR